MGQTSCAGATATASTCVVAEPWCQYSYETDTYSFGGGATIEACDPAGMRQNPCAQDGNNACSPGDACIANTCDTNAQSMPNYDCVAQNRTIMCELGSGPNQPWTGLPCAGTLCWPADANPGGYQVCQTETADGTICPSSDPLCPAP
jgi:hypothetical protein